MEWVVDLSVYVCLELLVKCLLLMRICFVIETVVAVEFSFVCLSAWVKLKIGIYLLLLT